MRAHSAKVEELWLKFHTLDSIFYTVNQEENQEPLLKNIFEIFSQVQKNGTKIVIQSRKEGAQIIFSLTSSFRGCCKKVDVKNGLCD